MIHVERWAKVIFCPALWATITAAGYVVLSSPPVWSTLRWAYRTCQLIPSCGG